ncbi:hypothetical protein GDO81_026719 [Engystomops pustulosus]|uniref:Uncharacterized protein n=1 Tax=Engystomops pustulosus TaxID=76066 RepID=A0AAV6YJK3_ENGPU|nr:hypothetical protein GDO81_026719 [Engystomops pustulosus]
MQSNFMSCSHWFGPLFEPIPEHSTNSLLGRPSPSPIPFVNSSELESRDWGSIHWSVASHDVSIWGSFTFIVSTFYQGRFIEG